MYASRRFRHIYIRRTKIFSYFTNGRKNLMVWRRSQCIYLYKNDSMYMRVIFCQSLAVFNDIFYSLCKIPFSPLKQTFFYFCRCSHNVRCSSKCAGPCIFSVTSDSADCEWGCEHSRCERECGKACSHVPCDKWCKRELNCQKCKQVSFH